MKLFRYIFSVVLFLLSIHSYSSQKSIVIGVELGNDSTASLIQAFYQAKLEMRLPQMDSLFQLINIEEDLSEQEEALKYYLLGYYYLYTDLRDEAAKQFNEGIQLAQRNQFREVELRCRTGMAGISYYNGDLKGSIEEIDQLLLEVDDELWELKAALLANLAAFYLEEVNQLKVSDKDRAEELKKKTYDLFEQSIQLLEAKNGKMSLCRIYSLYAMKLLRDHRYEETADYIRKACVSCREMNNQHHYFFGQIKWGIYLREVGELEASKDSIQKAIQYFESVKHNDLLYHGMKMLSQTFEKGNEYDSAYHYAVKMQRLKKKVTRDKILRQSNLYKTELEVYDKERKIVEQGKTIQLQRYEQQIVALNQKRWIIFGIAVLVTLLLIGLLFFQRVRQKSEVERERIINSERELAFKAVIDGQEQERKRIGQELHDGIGQQLSAIKMMIEQLTNNSAKATKDILNELKLMVDNTAHETRGLSHSMMPLSLLQHDLVSAIEDTLNTSLKSTGLEFTFEHYQLRGQYSEEVESSIFRVFQELLNNVIKHANAQKVAIQLYELDNQLILIVEDDGTGIKGENSEGKGIASIQSRLSTLGGQLTIEDGFEKGMLATASISVG